MSGVAVAAAALVGRDRELGWLDQLLREAAAGRSAVLVITGAAGIGKSALLGAVAKRAPVPVLSVAGVEHSAAPAYSGLATLCEPIRDHLRDLPPSHAGLLATALGWAPGGPEPTGPLGVGAALLGLLSGAAARPDRDGPNGLLVTVDDVDFVDPASRAALLFAVRRLSGEGVVVLIGTRPSDLADAELTDFGRMHLGGLHHAAGRALLAGVAPCPVNQAVADRLIDAAAGNPLALTEMAATLSADQLSGRQPLPRPLPVGARLRDFFAARALALPDASRRALVVAAASFGNLAVVGEALGRLGLSRADLDRVEDDGLVSLADGELSFRHPLTRCAVYHSATSEELRAVHGALAEANAAAGDVERQAWHLAQALASPEETAARVVEAAASSTLARGAPAEAADAFEHAARLSVDPAMRLRRLVTAAELWFAAGRIETAMTMADEVLARSPGIEERSRAVLVRGRALMVTSSEEEGRSYLMKEAKAVASADPSGAVAMAATASGSALRGGEMAQAVDAARLADALSGSADPDARLVAEMALASVQVASGDAGPRPRLVEMVEAELASPTALTAAVPVVVLSAALALVWAEDLDNAHRVLEQMENTARAKPLPAVLPAVLSTRALLEHRLNRWTRAEAFAAEALDLARQTGQEAIAPYAATVLATADAVLGNADRCREQCLLLLDGPSARIPVVRNGVLAALGLLELGQGRPDEAVRWYEVLSGAAGSPARAHPGIVMWGADLAEAYIDAGDTDKAAVVGDHLRRQAETSASARVAAAAKRVQAMLCPDDAEAEQLFAEALRHYGGPDWRFARARVGLARGRRLHRAGRLADAERRLRQSLELFEELGARSWAVRTSAELARLGVRAPSADNVVATLTALERQVAMAAAMGGSRTDIAAGLFLGEATVGAALNSAAAKLGLDGPDGFADRLPELVAGGWATPAGASARTRGTGSSPGDQVNTPPAPMVRLLGDCEVVVAGKATPCPPGPAGQLLKHVALAGRVPLEELVEELWPEAALGAGRNRLRTVLTRLRQSVGPLVVRDGRWIALAPGVGVDVRRFEDLAGAAQAAASASEPQSARLAAQALSVYRGPLLPVDRHLGFTAGPRERLRRRHLAMVSISVEDASARGDVDRAMALLEEAIEDNRHEEDLYVRAAEVLAAAGRPAAARAVLRRAASALADLGMPLSARARELQRSLGG